ncbi:MBL fold metallo-hydrolase [Actinomycetota bacterium]|nr:MBL fold metallo-hydrolase [Actinomycetota bacterium]
MSKRTLTFLGTGASCGVPSYYCGCKACEEALANPIAQRTCAGLLIKGDENTLIDAGPDLRMQLVNAEVKDLARAIFTHEHFDHIGGIPQLEYYVKLKTQQPLPIYAGIETLETIEQQFGFMNDSLEIHRMLVWEQLTFDQVSYTALPATHSNGAFGYLIEHNKHRIAYFPDTGPLQKTVIEKIQNLDILIIDATFNGNNWMPRSHHSINDAITLAQILQPKQTYLTHLSMHYDTPITVVELEKLLAEQEADIQVAFDGLTIAL